MRQPPPQETVQPVWQNVTVPVEHLVRLAVRGGLAGGGLLLLLYLLLWGLPELPGFGALLLRLGRGFVQSLLFLLVYAVSVGVHEGLHAMGMMLFAGVPWRAIHFRLRLREGIAYVHTEAPLTVRAYRAVLLLPAVVQGGLPLLGGLVLGLPWVVFYGYVMLVSSVGDFVVFAHLRGFHAEDAVRDHPHEVGCQVRPAVCG